jgi:glutathione synthase/RimK-type ligase-like ATP-grasp enzyme
MKVLIPTMPEDTHALYVKLALEKIGHQAILWYTADFPQYQKHSFLVKNDQIFWSACGKDFEINNDEMDVVWLRRPRRPVVPPTLHHDDIANAKIENTLLFQTFWQIVAPNAYWINPPASAKAANCKLLQLKIAKNVGFTVPHTLISNDPHAIKAFINVFKNGVIYKTLFPMFWLSEKELRLTYTKEIQIKDLPSDNTLQATPGIFQVLIPKAFELRITYFGSSPVAVKIKSQDHVLGTLDWRCTPISELDLELFKLPDIINHKCQLLMKKLNLVFGCFDFIVTPNGEYIFLEINEQGQFLWIEELNSEIKMLEKFIHFIVNPNITMSKINMGIHIQDFTDKVIKLREDSIKMHQSPQWVL